MFKMKQFIEFIKILNKLPVPMLVFCNGKLLDKFFIKLFSLFVSQPSLLKNYSTVLCSLEKLSRLISVLFFNIK